MKTRLLGLAIFLAVLLFGIENIQACSCAGNSTPILEFETTPIVFIGKVKSIAEDRVKIDRFGTEAEIRTGLAAYLDIVEPFKGTKTKEATILTGGGGGDCGFNFRVGETYFVFASPVNANNTENIASATVFGNPNPSRKELVGDVMTTHICTMTNNLRFMNDELEIIRDYLKGTPQSRIYGTVREYFTEFDGRDNPKFVGFVPNIKVVAEGQKGKFESVTDEQGSFRIKALPAGKYNLKFLLPDIYMTLWSWEKLEDEIEIEDKKDSEEVDLDTQPGGLISGLVLDAAGKPVNSGVQLSLIPVEKINEPEPLKHSRSEYTKDDGRFYFDGLRPGKYIMGINIAEAPARNTPYPKTYYPAGSIFSEAKIIEVKAGEKLRNIDFKMAMELPQFVVEGFVYSADGKPAAGVKVNIYDAETPNQRVFGFSDDIKTDANGHFKATGFKGRKYLLHAYKDTDYFAGKGVQSEQVAVVFDENTGRVKLILNKNGIFLDQLK